MGFSEGAFHVELKYTSAGPRLIEVNARIGGGPIYKLNRPVWNVDLAEQYLLTRLGLPIRPRKSTRPQTYIITSELPCPLSGIMKHIDFLKPLIGHSQVIHSKTYVEAAQFVTGPDKGVPDSLGEVMVQGDSIAAASEAIEKILASLNFPITPQPEG